MKSSISSPLREGGSGIQIVPSRVQTCLSRGIFQEISKSIEPADRLSELPDSLILKIFEFLPTRDVVRTPILSRRWKKLWTISPCLYFETNSDNNVMLRNFVNRALLCWRGTRIQKFKVSGVCFDASLFTEMDLWVLFAVDNRVEELDICFPSIDFDPDEVDYCFPKCLHSCSSLQKLSLNCSRLEIKGSVQWNRLKNLKIECFALNQHDIDQILCCSPLLEVFSLSFRVEESESEFGFRSCSLKKLSIYQTCSDSSNTDSVLRIWTPNLVMLTISGIQYDNCFLMNVSSVARADLLFYGTFFLWETLSQILPAIQHVEGLTLSHSCIKVLGAMKSESSLSPFLNVKFLSLTYRFKEIKGIVGLVEIFPKLKTLVVEDTSGGYVDPKSKVKFKPNPSESFLVELKTVEITWTRHDFLIFPFIKILLKYASKLENMVFRVKRTEPSNNMLLASKKLLRMPRSSPSAKLVFHEC